MSLVVQSPTRHQYGQVLIAVPRTVTHSTTYNYEGVVKDLRFLQTVEQAVHLTEYIILGHLKFGELTLALTVVRKPMITERYAVYIGGGKAKWNLKGRDPGRIGL